MDVENFSRTNTLSALRCLLTNYPYNSVLYSLYMTCTDLYILKPRMTHKHRRVYLVECSLYRGKEREHFYPAREGGNAIYVEGFYVDPEENRHHLYYDNMCFYIPPAWIKRLYYDDGSFYIAPYEFCCRLNVYVKGKICWMCVQDINLTDCDVFREMFHVGVGRCNDRSSMICYDNILLSLGYPKLFKIIEPRRLHSLLIALRNLDVDDTKILIHLIYCRKCCHYLADYIRSIVRDVIDLVYYSGEHKLKSTCYIPEPTFLDYVCVSDCVLISRKMCNLLEE